ncbi:hypothetical protein [Microtetraspora malaysiensis]|uniref:hypothetical protein n=1 Tax=Microtetraspora malaysiensis TaxID=161358 RepID=UPI003D934405
MPVKVIGSGTARASRTWVSVAVTDGPVGMAPLMAGTVVLTAKVLVVMAEALEVMSGMLIVMARTVWARMLLLVVIAA